MSQQFDLDILHHILNQFSKDLRSDCSRVIDKLLKSLSVPTDSEYQCKKTFGSVEVLLNLYEKLHQENEDNLHESELPVHLSVCSIQHVLQCNDESCKLPDNDVQCNILSIISFLFKNALLQVNIRNLDELVEFYNCILTSICNRGDNKECKTDCLLFKLKIINSIYHTLNTLPQNNIEFQERFKLISNVDESKLFGDLVLYQSNDIAIHTLMYLIPEHVKYFKSCRIVQIIWNLISHPTTDAAVDYSRKLAVLCKIFDFCFEEPLLQDNLNLITLLLEDSNYWKLLQVAVVDEDPLKRKQGLYLLKKTIDILNNTDTHIDCFNETLIFYWDSVSKDELYKIYSELITILEYFDEQQVHIIKPIFGMIDTVCKKIIEFGKVSFYWILLVYKKALMHESTQIVKWGLSSFLQLPVEFSFDKYIAEEGVGLLITTLNNMSLYYNQGWEITNELTDFLIRVKDSSISKNFFSLFIKHICCQVWSAETLVFVTRCLSGDTRREILLPCWGEEEIFQLKEFVSKAFITHNKIIRTEIQYELLDAVLHFTDHKNVSLESIILLISRFSLGEVMHFGDETWTKFTDWLFTSYPKEEFKNVIERYKRGELEKEFNEKCLCLIFILVGSFHVEIIEDSLTEQEIFLELNYLEEMLYSFKEIDKRLYCNKALQDKYLSVITHVYEAGMIRYASVLINETLPFVSHIIQYIQTQLQQISGLQEFNSCKFYLNAFENVIKTLFTERTNEKYVNVLQAKVLKDLEVACIEPDTSYIEMYYKMKLLSVILEFYPLNAKCSFLYSYLPKVVNEPLRKGNDYSKQTRDSQTLWGRMNSEFLEAKWKIFEYLLNKKIITHGQVKVGGGVWISDDDLVNLCVDALNVGGYGVLSPTMAVLKDLLPDRKNVLEARKIVDALWKTICERRKTEEFKLLIKSFVEMLFQEALILEEDFTQEILSEYTDIIFSDSSLSVVNIFLKQVQQINLPDISVSLFCHILGKGLLFGPVQRKDEKLTNDVCSGIEILKLGDPRKIGDFNLSQEIRARAVQKILMLDKNSETHKIAAKNLIKTLLKMESEINKNRVRYYGDSHTHRVKHRLMQALLILEPLLEPDEKEAAELWKWVADCLWNENSQPSVRCMQEWLAMRMIARHLNVFSRFNFSNFYYNREEVSKKSLCSLIVITFHKCSLVPGDVMEECTCKALSDILSLCFHEHFEIRLYAQVVFFHLYRFAEKSGMDKAVKKFELAFVALEEQLLTEKRNGGNFVKNSKKLINYFFITSFKPLEHYSLDTIYFDLPRLTNAAPDELISTKLFRYCGVDSYKMNIPLMDKNGSLKSELLDKRFFAHTSTASGDCKSDEILMNYQKKIIPNKPLIPDWDENDSRQKSTLKKGGLVVVASLIDRIPNLGGLARTCEIFGASEYVIHSLKCTEDKQFTSLSVTAEKWIPIKEVKTQNLLDYVLEMKQDGYTVIGAEQALHTLPLSAVKFPKKSLLLLGNEKEGIPPNLLPLLDICVEIPQLGIIRSLNVHVTGALFIWEYAKQNLF